MSEKARPRVSIGLPVYNGKNFLDETIDSHLPHTFEDFGLIIRHLGKEWDSGTEFGSAIPRLELALHSEEQRPLCV